MKLNRRIKQKPYSKERRKEAYCYEIGEVATLMGISMHELRRIGNEQNRDYEGDAPSR